MISCSNVSVWMLRNTEFSSNNITGIGISIYSATVWMKDVTFCVNWYMLQVYTDDGPENPLVGSYSVEELLDVFSSSAMV